MANRNGRRGGGKPRTSRTTWIVAGLVALAFMAYYLAYGFGGFATPDPQEAAEEAPTTEQPVEEFAADEEPPADEPADEPAQPGQQPQ